MLQHVTTGRLRLPGYNFDYQFFQLMLLRLPAAAAAAAAASAAAAAAAAGTATDSASVIIPVILVASFSRAASERLLRGRRVMASTTILF